MKYKKSLGENVFDTFNLLIMIFVFIVTLYPFVYVISYSLSESSKIVGGLMLWPSGFTLKNYIASFQISTIPRGVLISISRTVLGTAVMIFFNSMAAYALSRENVPLIPFFRKYFVFTMFFSGGLIPTYLLIKDLGMTGSYWVYIIPNIVWVFNMILIRTYIENLPEELRDAAVVDGANDMVLFFRILFPLMTPVLAAVGLFAAIWHWNAYIDTAIYNSMSPKLFSLQYVLYSFISSVRNISLDDLRSSNAAEIFSNRLQRKGLNMAVTVITVIPIACIYPLIRKHFASGLLIGSIKG